MTASRVPTDPNLTPEMRWFLDDLARSIKSLALGLVADQIVTPANQDYRIVEDIPFAAKITGFSAKTSSGTITATLKINTTTVTDGAINVTSTRQSVSPTAENVVAAGDAIVLTLSANAAAANLSYTVKFTRTL